MDAEGASKWGRPKKQLKGCVIDGLRLHWRLASAERPCGILDSELRRNQSQGSELFLGNWNFWGSFPSPSSTMVFYCETCRTWKATLLPKSHNIDPQVATESAPGKLFITTCDPEQREPKKRKKASMLIALAEESIHAWVIRWQMLISPLSSELQYGTTSLAIKGIKTVLEFAYAFSWQKFSVNTEQSKAPAFKITFFSM